MCWVLPSKCGASDTLRRLHGVSVHVCVQLVPLDTFPIALVELDHLRRVVSIHIHGSRRTILTPPDFGILTTVTYDPNARCISTLSFSWPATRMMFTVQGSTSVRCVATISSG
jgi:hypothetical protein